MFYDEDGDLAHEFYEETIVTKSGAEGVQATRCGPEDMARARLMPQMGELAP